MPRCTAFAGADLPVRPGNAWTRYNKRIHKNGQDTGFVCEGHFDVTPDGHVYHVTNVRRGILKRDGQSLGFSIQGR